MNLLWLLGLTSLTVALPYSNNIDNDNKLINRAPPRTHKLPNGFLWGAASASYQIEGNTKEGGRGPSIWDTFFADGNHSVEGATGDPGSDSYHRYPEDIALLKSYGASAYRFSIAWPRIIPKGGKNDPVNGEGIEYYNKLINEVINQGLVPFVTIYHWDAPQALEDKYGSWLSERIVDDYERYARVLFENFGDRVKNWITLNEPLTISAEAYVVGVFAPGHTDLTESYKVAKNQIMAHARAYHVYKNEYAPRQNGQIGITLNGNWFEPADKSQAAKEAAQVSMDFQWGLYADPIFKTGDYPQSMHERNDEYLSKFTPEEKKYIAHTADFMGMNSYTSSVTYGNVTDNPSTGFVYSSFQFPNGTMVGSESNAGWLWDAPWGFEKLLIYLWETYHYPIYITENGFTPKDEDLKPLTELIEDYDRVNYHDGYLNSMSRAIQKGADIRSYFAWAITDNLEWASGYSSRFGITHVDFDTQVRTPKLSSQFLKEWFEVRLT